MCTADLQVRQDLYDSIGNAGLVWQHVHVSIWTAGKVRQNWYGSICRYGRIGTAASAWQDLPDSICRYDRIYTAGSAGTAGSV